MPVPIVRHMGEPEAFDRTRRDYDAVAEIYDEMARRGDLVTDAFCTAMVDTFARLVRTGGSENDVLDAGCGPGQWTDHLDRAGVRAHGIDLSPALITIARRRRPDLRFEVRSMLELDAPDQSIAGILAGFSLIHTPPDLLPRILAEFGRAIEPGGPLLVGVQVTDTTGADGWIPYDHKASPAYLWNMDVLSDLVRVRGFRELGRMRIAPPAPGKPPAGYLLMRQEAR